VFVLSLTYLTPLDAVDALLERHRAYLDEHYASGRFLVSGRKVPRTGGVILAAGDDLEEIERIVATDPFVVEGVARYDVVRMQPTMASPALRDALQDAGEPV
jgi:uncharacterized protein YciI